MNKHVKLEINISNFVGCNTLELKDVIYTVTNIGVEEAFF